MKITLMLIIMTCLAGCVYSPQGPALEDHAIRNVCVDSMCHTLENSGPHYQQKQQGYIFDIQR